MKSLRLRAIVLTAGFGSRLRPLTYFLPKALLPICGEPVAGHTLRQLARQGCESAVLNLHHLGDAIPARFGSSYQGLPLRYSREEEIQGTLGALFPQREHLAEADLVLVANGDTLCHWPWRSMIRQHLRTGADATLLLHRRAPDAFLGGPVGVDDRGAVVQLRDAEPAGRVVRRHLFAGAHVLSPGLLARLEEGPADIVDGLYMPLLKAGGRIQGVVTGRRWHDLGTPERYLEACLDWARYRRRLAGPRSVVSPRAEVDETAAVRRSVIEAGAVVRGGARIDGSVLLANARIPSGCSISGSIVGPRVELPNGAVIERRMVTRILSGYQPGAQDSVMGDLVYTPLEPAR